MDEKIKIAHQKTISEERDHTDPRDMVVVSGQRTFDKKMHDALKELASASVENTGSARPVIKNRAQRREEEKRNRRKAKTTKRGTAHV